MHRMDVIHRYEQDPMFKALVDMLMAWMMEHSDFTPTELREAVMFAAHRIDLMTVRRTYIFKDDGTLLPPDKR